MGVEDGALQPSFTSHVTSDTNPALMWSVCVSTETVRQRCKQGDPLPPTDSLSFLNSASHFYYIHELICNIIQRCKTEKGHVNQL